MSYANIALCIEGAVARLALARPEKLNPLDWSTVKELRRAVAEIEAKGGVRAVVLTGQGRAFSAGGDLGGYIDLYRKPDRFRAFLEDFYALLDAIERARAIWIAAVNGACVAGGLELLLACDLALAAEEARIGDGHLNFGQLPGAGGSQRLPRAIGVLRAKDLMLTGRLIDGREAERIGLVNRAVPLAGLEEAALALAQGLLDKSPAGVRGMKHLVNVGMHRSLEDGLRLEIEHVHTYATTHPDAMEGLIAFRDKRKPAFGQD